MIQFNCVNWLPRTQRRACRPETHCDCHWVSVSHDDMYQVAGMQLPGQLSWSHDTCHGCIIIILAGRVWWQWEWHIDCHWHWQTLSWFCSTKHTLVWFSLVFVTNGLLTSWKFTSVHTQLTSHKPGERTAETGEGKKPTKNWFFNREDIFLLFVLPIY